MSKLINCISETIKLKITNNSNVDIPIEVMRLFPQGIDKTKLVQWDVSGESYDTSYVSLGTTTPLVGYAKTLDIFGVVEVLNSFNVATFFYVGTTIYAVNLKNASVATADLTIGTSSSPPFVIGTGFNLSISAIIIQSDGKIVVGGSFTTYNSLPQTRIARLNTDGSLDTSLVIGTGFNGTVLAIELQSDGKIIVGGSFTDYNGTAVNNFARLNTNGSIDNTFIQGTGFNSNITTLAIQADGKILAGGNFTDYNGNTVGYIVRVDSSGGYDATLAQGTGFTLASTVQNIKLQADGKIIVGGTFLTYDSVSSPRLIRLSTLGIKDATFNVGTGCNNGCDNILIQPDGNIIISGVFTTYNGTPARRIARLTTLGAIDGTFVYGNGFDATVREVRLQSDEKLIVVGNFTDYDGNAINRIVRLDTDGTFDGTFISGTGFDADVLSLAVQSDDKIIAGGQLLNYDGTPYGRIVRLLSDGTTDTV